MDRRHGTERALSELLERLAHKYKCEVHLYSQRVEDPPLDEPSAGDVLLDGDKIAEVALPGRIAEDHSTEVFDATGLIVAPGFIDLHAHLREPGQESSETIETGTRSAARGGFTAVC